MLRIQSASWSFGPDMGGVEACTDHANELGSHHRQDWEGGLALAGSKPQLPYEAVRLIRVSGYFYEELIILDGFVRF